MAGGESFDASKELISQEIQRVGNPAFNTCLDCVNYGL